MHRISASLMSGLLLVEPPSLFCLCFEEGAATKAWTYTFFPMPNALRRWRHQGCIGFGCVIFLCTMLFSRFLHESNVLMVPKHVTENHFDSIITIIELLAKHAYSHIIYTSQSFYIWLDLSQIFILCKGRCKIPIAQNFRIFMLPTYLHIEDLAKLFTKLKKDPITTMVR